MPLDLEQITGRSSSHLLGCADPELRPHQLLPETLAAFSALREQAQAAGLDLKIASSFRDYQRQKRIWDGKFLGERPMLSHTGQPLLASSLTPTQRIEAILRWSALPGTSRHHWGSDLDVYDGAIGSQEYRLQLVPDEYLAATGPCHRLYQWLQQHAPEFGFYWPYREDRGGTAPEPWHLSHRPCAERIQPLLTAELVSQALRADPVAGQAEILAQLPELLARFRGD